MKFDCVTSDNITISSLFRDLSPPWKNWVVVGNYIAILILLCEVPAHINVCVSSVFILFASAHEVILASCLLCTTSPSSIPGVVLYNLLKSPGRLEQYCSVLTHLLQQSELLMHLGTSLTFILHMEEVECLFAYNWDVCFSERYQGVVLNSEIQLNKL